MPVDLPIAFPEKVRAASRLALLRSMMSAAITAWTSEIEPRMSMVRAAAIDAAARKKGTDFFTQADIASERAIVEALVSEHGADGLRIFGEEAGAYSGNPDAAVTIRIDPIDGTESFKFGKPTWSIMIGAYVGRGASERQVAAVVYWPEYYSEILFLLDDAGVFKADLRSKVVTEFPRVDAYDELDDIIVTFWKHSNIAERGRIDDIVRALEMAGARTRTVTPVEVKEALETRGRRAMILDGDFTLVDFVSYSALTRLGYSVRGWDGAPCSIDDPALSNRKIVVLPPGRAGDKILEIVRRYA
jgi:fructose-1,6-bisphosphatase/inositol monophosphatase family enzyme